LRDFSTRKYVIFYFKDYPMFPESGVSLLASVWPQEGSKEEKSLHGKVGVPEKGKPAHYKANYQKMLTIAQVVLIVCESAAEAVCENRYSAFDALVKNFGCHITALAVQRTVKKTQNEAARMRDLCREKLQKIAVMFQKPPVGECGQTLAKYCQHVGVDITLSQEFCDLVCFRFLHIIHDKKAVGNEEVPITCVDPLERVKNTLETGMRGQVCSFETWVEGVQARESKKAVRFIQQVADTLDEPIYRKMVSEEHVRQASKSSVVAVPQSYSTEAVMRAMKGILVVKNKLTIAGRPVLGVKRDVVFMRMPEQKILSEDEVMRVKPDKPVVVLEGFQANRPLVELIHEMGIFALVQSSLKKLPEYTADFNVPQDVEPGYYTLAFRVDHMYCASMEEVRHV
jgi:hypothetical protein